MDTTFSVKPGTKSVLQFYLDLFFFFLEESVLILGFVFKFKLSGSYPPSEVLPPSTVCWTEPLDEESCVAVASLKTPCSVPSYSLFKVNCKTPFDFIGQ